MHPCLWFAALSVVILHSGGASAAAPSALLTLDTAEVAVRLDGEPAFGPSVPAALPHNWDRLYPGRSGRAVYRITLPSPAAADASYAVYLSRVGSRFEAFAGGVVIARFGQSDEYANFAGQPVVLAVPQRALTEDRILELRVSVDAMARGGVAPLLFGTEQEIRSHASGEAWGRTYVPLMTLAVLGLLIALSLVLWIKTREPLYGYFVGLAAAWVVRIGSGFITHPPLGLTLWSALYFAAYPLYAGFLFLFTVELFSLKRVIHRPAITCIMLAALAGAMLAVLTGMPAIYTVTVGLLALAGTYYYALVASVTFKQPSVERWLFLTAGGLNVVAGLRDWLVIRLDPGGLGVVDWSRQTVFLFNFVMAGIIVNRFIKSLRAYQLLNADLAQRIALRETELARAYDERRAIERRRRCCPSASASCVTCTTVSARNW